MIENKDGYKVGDVVIINNADYIHFTVGKAYGVVCIDTDWVGLFNDLGLDDCGNTNPSDCWCFYNEEVSRHILEE